MLELVKSLYDNTKTPISLEFVQLVLAVENSIEDEALISQELILANFDRISKDFHDYLLSNMLEDTKYDEDFLRRWNMTIKSDFSPKLWEKFTDITDLIEIKTLEWTNNKFDKNKYAINTQA